MVDLNFPATMVAEHENAVAGSILIDPKCLPDIGAILSPSDFYGNVPGAIFEAAMSLDLEGAVVDPYTIQARAQQRGTEISAQQLLELMDTTLTARNADIYAQYVKGHSRNRGMYALATEILNRLSTGEDSGDIEEFMRSALDELSASGNGNGVASSLETISEWYSFQMNKDAESKALAVSTGYGKLDAMLGGGMVNGGLYIIGARPGMGKTTLGLCIADNIASRKLSVLFISLEMSKNEIAAKRIAREAGIPYQRALIGPLWENEKSRVPEAAQTLSDVPLYMTDKPSMSVQDILFAARGIKGLAAVVIDYLSLIKPADKSNSRYDRMTGISNDLKNIAKLLKVPVICLAQLNRETEGQRDKRPRLATLRETGAIEQDAHVVMLLYRDEYYNSEGSAGAAPGEKLEVIIAKNRHGSTGTVNMTWYGATGRIYENR